MLYKYPKWPCRSISFFRVFRIWESVRLRVRGYVTKRVSVMATSKPGTSKRVNVFDSDFENQAMLWFEEINSDNSDIEAEENVCIESDHESASEQEASGDEQDYLPSDNENDNVVLGDSDTSDSEASNSEASGANKKNKSKQKYIYGKNRCKWSTSEPVRKIRTQAHNIIRLPSSRLAVEDKTDPKSFFNQLFSAEMYNLVIEHTNKKLENMRQNYKRPNKPELAELTVGEMNAFIGLLLYTAIFKSNDEDIRSIFATDGTGRDVFRAVMSMERFSVLLVALRFDNAETREERKKHDPAAAISELFNLFVENAKKSYVIGATACVDEMLVGFRGKCKFKMYIPSKPEKYGIKIMALTDARTQYFYNAYIYAGKDTDGFGLLSSEKKLSKPSQSIVRLAKPLYNSNRNITADNWFSSLELAEYLLKNGLTFVGTMKKK